MADLKTNYKDDVLDTSKNEKRKFRMIQNDDGTVSFDDATEYTQQGDAFGAADINATNAKINEQSQSLTNEQKSMAGYYDVNFHNTYTKKSNRTFIEIATKNDVNLTANTWIKLGLPVPLPKYSVNHKAPCTIINGSTTYVGMVMVSTDGQIKVWSPLTVTSCQIIANFSYDI